MSKIGFLVILGVMCSVLGITDYTTRGLSTNIDWMTYREALNKAKENEKPIMVLFTKPWCNLCKDLKQGLMQSSEFVTMASLFNMVNIETEREDLEVKHSKLSPDGDYVPIVLFVATDGFVEHDITNIRTPNPVLKYYYPDAPTIVAKMKVAIRALDETLNKRKMMLHDEL